jgi:lysine/ornithine N-monooxygenase
VTGQFPVLTGHTVTSAATSGDGVRLQVTGPAGRSKGLAADHVIAATGFRADLGRLPFLGDDLREALRTVAGTAWVGAGYESSMLGCSSSAPRWRRPTGR